MGWTLRVLEMMGAFRVRRGFLAGGPPFATRGSGSELGGAGGSAVEAGSFNGVPTSGGVGVFFFLGALGFLVVVVVLAGEGSDEAEGTNRRTGLPVKGSTSNGAPSIGETSDGPGRGVLTMTAPPGLDRFLLVAVFGFSNPDSFFTEEADEEGGSGVTREFPAVMPNGVADTAFFLKIDR
jgi:hypothetical protein